MYGFLKPRHYGYPVRVQAYRYERQRNGKYLWKLRYTFSAKASNYSSYTKYTAKVKLAYAGKWKFRAYHADAGHAPTYSAYSRSPYTTVK